MKKICLFVLVATFATAPGWFANSLAAQDKSDAKKESKKDQDDDEDEEETLEDRMRDAMMTFREDEEEGLDKLRAIYKDHSDDFRVGLTLVRILQQQAFQIIEDEDRAAGNANLFEAARIAREIANNDDLPSQANATLAQAVYNAACSHGVNGDKDKAMTVLKEAFEMGFAEFELVEEDSDFGDLLEAEEFIKLIADQRVANVARMKAKLVSEIAEFESFDFDFETENMDGDDLTLAGLKGKVVIVDFWGTWCPPCREEIPSYVKLKKALGDKIEIVGFAYERGDDDEAYDNVVEFMEDNDINYECALGDEDLRDMVPDFQGYPTTLFIDAEGTVKFMKVGASSYDRLESIVNHLLENTNEK